MDNTELAEKIFDFMMNSDGKSMEEDKEGIKLILDKGKGGLDLAKLEQKLDAQLEKDYPDEVIWSKDTQWAKVVMLPSKLHSNVCTNIANENPDKLYYTLDTRPSPLTINQHLYFIAGYDEDTDDGDWIYWEGNLYEYVEFMKMKTPVYTNFYKVLATTDISLKTYTDKSLRVYEVLPQVPEAFVRDFVIEEGKIIEVQLEMENVASGWQQLANHGAKGSTIVPADWQLKITDDSVVVINKIILR